MSAGRPTKYLPEYAEQVLDYMGRGFSLTAFAGSIRVSRECVYEWERKIPEFSDAVKAARSARVSTLEEQLLGMENGPSVTARIFALKNACPDEWRDKQQLEHTGADGGAIQIVTKAQRDAAVKAALEADG